MLKILIYSYLGPAPKPKLTMPAEERAFSLVCTNLSSRGTGHLGTPKSLNYFKSNCLHAPTLSILTEHVSFFVKNGNDGRNGRENCLEFLVIVVEYFSQIW